MYLLATCCPSTPELFSSTPIECGSLKLPLKIIKIVLCYWILFFFTVHSTTKHKSRRGKVWIRGGYLEWRASSLLPKSKHLIEEWAGSGWEDLSCDWAQKSQINSGFLHLITPGLGPSRGAPHLLPSVSASARQPPTGSFKHIRWLGSN